MVELCRVCEGVSYVNRHNPLCSGVNRGEGQNEIDIPLGLSTDRHNGDVFVCDWWLIGFRCLPEKVFIRKPSIHKDCIFLLV